MNRAGNDVLPRWRYYTAVGDEARQLARYEDVAAIFITGHRRNRSGAGASVVAD
jgi:hypothetical protein